jgi:type III restriction enzyme
MIVLKKFQEDTLKALEDYLEAARLCGDPEAAFVKTVKTPDGRLPLYRKVPEMETVPYVCLRLPTGGGKTIVGAYAIRVAAQSYIEKDFPVVLWLVPSNSIRTQTAAALKNPAHSYRIALDEAFEGKVKVFEISEIENIRPQDLRDSVCIVVGTIQTSRVQDTENRDVYAHKEAFEDHFTRVNCNVPGLEKIESGADAGKVKYSFANLMMIHRPLIIADEGHHNHTDLTFKTFKRLSPSAIIELTATPDLHAVTGSNVLYSVSASELKAEEMIKLPIVLTVHEGNWGEAVTDACLTRKRLAEMAGNECDYIRPILLIQAENKDRPANVDAVKKHLLEAEHLSEDQIAIVTGDQRDLDKINLFDPSCKIEAVITVQALKEGWDCSFAYVFCSTANIGSSKDVEQLLGRVLRMPYARRRKTPELNKAYAHVSSPNFMEAAKHLETSMIAMGFEDTEAQQYIEVNQPSLPDLPLFLQQNPLRLTVAEPLNLENLTERERESIIVTSAAPGKIEIEVHGPITPHIQRAALAAIPESARGEAEQKIQQHIAEQQPHLAPAQSGGELRVPRLCVRYDGELLPFDSELVLDAAAWDLSQHPADLGDFRFNDTSKTFEFDVQGSKVVYSYKGEQQLDLNLMAGDWTENDLIRWLDKELQQRDPRRDIRQEASLAWLRGCVRQLLDRKGFDLALLVRAKFILSRNLALKRDEARTVAYNAGYQEMLFGPSAAPETSFEHSFRYDPFVYPAHTLYTGKYRFAKHFYSVIGELEAKGEEFECALALDTQSGVKHWVRNLAKQETASMWLQTKTDKFYPDFMAELVDGRILMVEYKGAPYETNDDSEEKKLLGEVWESKSNGKALFLMAVKKDAKGRGVFDQIKAKIEGR